MQTGAYWRQILCLLQHDHHEFLYLSITLLIMEAFTADLVTRATAPQPHELDAAKKSTMRQGAVYDKLCSKEGFTRIGQLHT